MTRGIRCSFGNIYILSKKHKDSRDKVKIDFVNWLESSE